MARSGARPGASSRAGTPYSRRSSAWESRPADRGRDQKVFHLRTQLQSRHAHGPGHALPPQDHRSSLRPDMRPVSAARATAGAMARQNSPVSTGPRPVDSSVSHSANPAGTSTRFTPRFRSALAAGGAAGVSTAPGSPRAEWAYPGPVPGKTVSAGTSFARRQSVRSSSASPRDRICAARRIIPRMYRDNAPFYPYFSFSYLSFPIFYAPLIAPSAPYPVS